MYSSGCSLILQSETIYVSRNVLRVTKEAPFSYNIPSFISLWQSNRSFQAEETAHLFTLVSFPEIPTPLCSLMQHMMNKKGHRNCTQSIYYASSCRVNLCKIMVSFTALLLLVLVMVWIGSSGCQIYLSTFIFCFRWKVHYGGNLIITSFWNGLYHLNDIIVVAFNLSDEIGF